MRGYHTTEQAAGAEPNGTVMAKTLSTPSDSHQDGARCIVIGSVAAHGLIGYFVEWTDAPGIAVFVAGHRLKRTEAS